MDMRLLSLLLVLPLTVSAEVYRTVDEHGNVTFTDQPSDNAERVKLAPVSTFTPPKTAAPAAEGEGEAADEDAEGPMSYQGLSITAPANDAAVRENSGNVTIDLSLQPALASDQGHRIQVYLNGKPFGKAGTATSYNFTNLDRGSHTVKAAVVDSTGKTLIDSDTVTFHMLRVIAPRPAPAG